MYIIYIYIYISLALMISTYLQWSLPFFAPGFPMNCLRGKRVGFIGFGNIAQQTAMLCRAMRMKLVAHCRWGLMIINHLPSGKLT